MDPLGATHLVVFFNSRREGRWRCSLSATATGHAHPLLADVTVVPTVQSPGDTASVVDEDAGNGCFHWLLFYSLQETGVKDTDFKPLRDSKAAEKTTFRNFQLKLIIEEFSFGETVKEQTTSLPICA